MLADNVRQLLLTTHFFVHPKPMALYQDDERNFQIATGINYIERAIVEAVIHLGSNYRHPLLFNVQVIPGDEIGTNAALFDSPRASKSRVRRKIS